MRLSEYLELRDGFFASEVYRALRFKEMPGEEAQSLVAEAFERARAEWTSDGQAAAVTEELGQIEVPESFEEEAELEITGYDR